MTTTLGILGLDLWDRRRSLAMLIFVLLVSASALFLRPASIPVHVPVLVFTTGLLLVSLICRFGGLPTVGLVVVLGVYGLHATSAVVLYGISSLGLPILSDYQMGGGFWMFAPDAATYHRYALSMLKSWHYGIEFNIPLTGVDFQIYCGLVYQAIGPSPLGLILLNSWYAALTAFFAYKVVRRIGAGQEAAILAAALVGFWPSSVLWSSTILKDPLLLLLEVGAIFLLVSLAGRCWNGTTSPRLGEQARFVGELLFLCAVLFLIAKFRDYMGQTLIFGSWALFCVLGTVALARHAWAYAARAMLAIFLLTFTFLGSGWVNLLAFVSPRHPEVALQLDAESHDALPPVMERPNPDGLAAPTVQPPISTFLTPKLRVNPSSPLSGLKGLRSGFLRSGGELIGEEVIRIGSLWETLLSIPAAVGVALFYPLPWRWAEFMASGVKARFYLFETVMLFVLMPFVFGGVMWFVRERRWSGLFLFFFAVLFLMLQGLVVANYGTLFRLRLQFLVALVMIAAIGVERLVSYGCWHRLGGR